MRAPSYLPPERTFTHELRTELRGRILRGISEPEPRRGRLLMPLAAAVAVLLVVALSLLLTRVNRPTHVVPADQQDLHVPGYTTQQLQELTRTCKRSFNNHEGHDEFADMRLYNVHKGADGLLALFYGSKDQMQCGYEGYHADLQWPTVPKPQAGGSMKGAEGVNTWLADPLERLGGIFPGGDVRPGTGTPGRVAYYQMYGRVAPYVVRVKYTVGKKSATVPVVNGTFIVTIFTTTTDDGGEGTDLVGYRKDGSVVRNRADREVGGKVPCVTAPDGTVIEGDPNIHPEGCYPAIRWR